ncbi:hypothetical protein [Streptodolium elevatio]
MPLPAAPPVATQMQRRPRRLWALAPILTTVLAVPASVLLLIMFGLSAMAFDSCEPPTETTCPAATAAIERAVEFALLTLLPLILVWVWPRSARFNTVRWIMAAAYVAVVMTAVTMFLNIPAGR